LVNVRRDRPGHCLVQALYVLPGRRFPNTMLVTSLFAAPETQKWLSPFHHAVYQKWRDGLWASTHCERTPHVENATKAERERRSAMVVERMNVGHWPGAGPWGLARAEQSRWER
jgi:hypothetical protein